MNNNDFKKGFGVLEVLIASTIIITILGALITVGSMSIRTNEQLLQKTEATYLAQEGIEMVRQIRDSNWIDSSNQTEWDNLIWDSGVSAKPNKNNMAVYALSNNATRPVLVSNSSGEQIVIGTTTFVRKIKFAQVGTLLPSVSGDDLSKSKESVAMKVVVNISWPGKEDGILMSELLTNWRPNF